MPLRPFLDAAAAHPDFKRDVLEFVRGSESGRIVLEGHAPRVKIERVLTKLFSTHPELPVERVTVSARSGCSDFTGTLVAVVAETEHRFNFSWCCAWRAEEQGWRDCYGFWDQGRAAREFGWNCFRTWERVGAMERLPA
jgi:hypothetical protein